MSYDYEPNNQAPLTDADKLEVSPTTLRWAAREMQDAIVRVAAETLVEQVRRDLASDIRNAVKTTIDQQIGDIVRSVLDGSIQQTNEWGEPKGDPMPLRDMVLKAGREDLGVKVNKEGVPTSYNAEKTRIEHIVSKTVAECFSYQMQAEVKKAVEQARIEAVARVGAVVGDMVLKLTK